MRKFQSGSIYYGVCEYCEKNADAIYIHRIKNDCIFGHKDCLLKKIWINELKKEFNYRYNLKLSDKDCDTWLEYYDEGFTVKDALDDENSQQYT